MAEPPAEGRDLLNDRGAVLTGVGLLMGLVAEVLQLDIEAVAAETVGREDAAQAEEGGVGFAVAAGVDKVTDLSVAAGGEADQPFGVSLERVEGDERVAVALGVG